MISDGYIIGDGSWELRIYVTDLQVERTIRVKGDLHIGGVMFKLVEDLGMYEFHHVALVTLFTFARGTKSKQPLVHDSFQGLFLTNTDSIHSFSMTFRSFISLMLQTLPSIGLIMHYGGHSGTHG